MKTEQPHLKVVTSSELGVVKLVRHYYLKLIMGQDLLCGIYKITSPSGRVYIGESKNIHSRWKSYKNLSCKGQRKLLNSLKKYGVKNHIFEVIEECEFDELLCRERFWQDFYCVITDGLNCRLTECGDSKGIFSEETKRKISESRIGISMSEETKQKIRDNHCSKQEGWVSPRKGEPSWCKGITHSKEHIEKATKARVEKGSHKFGNNSKAKKVINIETKEIVSCAEELATLLKINSSTLRSKLNGSNINDTVWVYLQDYLENPYIKTSCGLTNVIDIHTLIIYKTISECARELNYNRKKLGYKLSGKYYNDTSIVFLKDFINKI